MKQSLILSLFHFFILSFLFSSCDDIAEADRLTYVALPEVKRAVLIEDFTGQRCVNCPAATEQIKALQEQYGEDKVIAVAIHGGGFGVASTNTRMTGLATPDATEYYTHWNISAQPSGMVCRQGVLDYNDWTEAVAKALSQTSPIELTLSQSNGTIEVKAIASTRYEGKLQLWIVEDGITAPQANAQGKLEMDYVHHHIYRGSVNGLWGTAVSLGESVFTQSFPIDWTTIDTVTAADYATRQLSCIAFFYNDNGVQQVSKISL